MERLLRHLSLEPPPAYQHVTLAQVMRADKEVFTYLAHNVADIRPDANDVRPLDAALEDALKDHNTAFHLLPCCHCPKRIQLNPQYARTLLSHTQLKAGTKVVERASMVNRANPLGRMPPQKATAVVLAEMARTAHCALISTSVSAVKLPQGEHAQRGATFALRLDASKRILSRRGTRTKLAPTKSDQRHKHHSLVSLPGSMLSSWIFFVELQVSLHRSSDWGWTLLRSTRQCQKRPRR